MSAKAELYAEIGQLKSLVEQLQREAAKVPKLEADLRIQAADASFFKSEAEKARRLKDQAEKSLKVEREAKKKLKHAVDEARKSQLNAEKLATRLKSDLHFDKLAREGQVKRARIMEHELAEVKHDNFLQTKLRHEAEHRSKKTYAELQKERSMRLQDIHERNKVLIEKNQSESNERIAEFSRFQAVNKANLLESKVGGLEAAVNSQVKMIRENDVEINDSMVEIEATKLGMS